jgi:hypothetical protein
MIHFPLPTSPCPTSSIYFLDFTVIQLLKELQLMQYVRHNESFYLLPETITALLSESLRSLALNRNVDHGHLLPVFRGTFKSELYSIPKPYDHVNES